MRRRRENGSVSVWALLLTAGAFTLLLGLVVDGGRAIDARFDAARVARQAARLGADQISVASVRSGGDAVSPAAATAEVHRFLEAAGKAGTVSVRDDRVTVTVTGASTNSILNVIGIESFPVRESETAEGITGEDSP